MSLRDVSGITDVFVELVPPEDGIGLGHRLHP